MSPCRFTPLRPPRAALLITLLALGGGLGGCASMSEGMLGAFADPAKYDLYDCKQLEGTRKALATHAAEVQGLMAKADTGVAGPVVAEVAYRNDYISTRASEKVANEVWERNKCVESPNPPPAAPATPPPAKHHHHDKGASGQ